MALRSALVDQGYLHRRTRTVKRVGGRSLYKDNEGPMFRVRLDLGSAPENVREGRLETVPRPRLLTGKRDSEGNLLEFHSSDVVRVVSAQLGEADWEVDGDPEPLRKRRTVIGWLLNVSRVSEQEPEEV